jgi:fumarylacetoacetate (FAA) hydrolase
MKLAHFLIPNEPISALGIVAGEFVIDIRAAWAIGELDIAVSNSLIETICLNLESGALLSFNERLHEATLNQTTEGTYRLEEVSLLAPIQPRSFRDFYAFEVHVMNARKKRGLPMTHEWYEQPVFYFSNAASIIGPDSDIRKPPDTQALDYELEIAAVIGKEGRDIPGSVADSHIAGFTILNDWSARDIQMREMKVGLGPAKGKDFATSIGPFLVTPDELEDRIVDPCLSTPENRLGELEDRIIHPSPPTSGERLGEEVGLRYDLIMTARVNGKEYSRGNFKDIHWTFAELIERASKNTILQPGDLIGSGTVGTGCILEFVDGTYPWLEAGDVVELEIERLGVLRNRVVANRFE